MQITIPVYLVLIFLLVKYVNEVPTDIINKYKCYSFKNTVKYLKQNGCIQKINEFSITSFSIVQQIHKNVKIIIILCANNQCQELLETNYFLNHSIFSIRIKSEEFSLTLTYRPNSNQVRWLKKGTVELWDMGWPLHCGFLCIIYIANYKT